MKDLRCKCEILVLFAVKCWPAIILSKLTIAMPGKSLMTYLRTTLVDYSCWFKSMNYQMMEWQRMLEEHSLLGLLNQQTSLASRVFNVSVRRTKNIKVNIVCQNFILWPQESLMTPYVNKRCYTVLANCIKTCAMST